MTDAPQVSEHSYENQPEVRPGGRGLPYITDGDARRNFQKKPLKVTIFSGCGTSQCTSENFIYINNTGILKITAKGQQVLL